MNNSKTDITHRSFGNKTSVFQSTLNTKAERVSKSPIRCELHVRSKASVPVPRARDVSPPLRGPEKMTYEKMQRKRAQQKENKEKRIML